MRTDADLQRELIEKGGFSIGRQGAPHSGFMVSREGSEQVVPGVAGPSEIAQFRQAHSMDLARPGYYMGGWVDRGRTYLDVSQQFPTEESAGVQAGVHHQLAYYDVGHDAAKDAAPILPFPNAKKVLDIADVPQRPRERSTGAHHAVMNQTQFPF